MMHLYLVCWDQCLERENRPVLQRRDVSRMSHSIGAPDVMLSSETLDVEFWALTERRIDGF